MAFNIDRYFQILTFLKDNPTIVSKCRIDGKVYKGKLDFCPDHGTKVDHISLQEYITDESLTNTNRIDLMIDIMDWDPVTSLSLPKDFTVANTALESRDKIRNYFGNVIVLGSYAYNTNDIELFRKLVVDWSAAARTFKDLMRQASDAFSLDDEDIDKAIRGFGIDFVNQKTLPNLNSRQIFLLALTELYKIKGTADSIVNSLYYAGLTNCYIREFWVEREPRGYQNIRLKGIASGKWEQELIDNKYEWKQDQTLLDDSILSWQNFQTRLIEIGDPHWWYTEKQIIDINWNPNTWMKLPSITPYFGVNYVHDIEKYNTIMGIVEKSLSAQFNAYLQGQSDLIPRDIGISGFNEDLSERDLWIEGYNEAITLLESFLGWTYAQIRSDEYKQYIHLYDFLDSKHIVIDNSEYEYPWAYQELIYSLCKRINDGELIDGILPLDAIIKRYNVSDSTNYYCSNNELMSWWINRPVDPLDSSDPNPHTPANIPTIFYDTEYPFIYQIDHFDRMDQTDTTMDKILFYNGERNADFNEDGFEYTEIIEDQNRVANQDTVRVEYDNVAKSYQSSNLHNEYQNTTYDAIRKHQDEFFEYISWCSDDYTEDIEHDGSSLTPYFVQKFPQPKQWNWAVDSDYFYYCKSPSNWVRTKIEISWSNTPILPNSSSDNHELGYHTYDDGYVYIYASVNKWVRYQCQIEWDYCDGPVTPDGHLRLRSDTSRTHIKAKVPEYVATIWLSDDQSDIEKKTFDFIVGPLCDNPITYQYTASDLDNYINTHHLVMDENGYLLVDFNRVCDGNFIFTRMTDDNDVIVWVRTLIENEWTSNGSKFYQGGYHFPNLDLTNRYDAERILRGQFVLNITDLNGLEGSTNGGEILVSNGNDGYPEIWIYDEILSIWKKDPINRVSRIPGKPEIKQVNLGFNNNLISWIDTKATSEEDYETTADSFLVAFSNYTKRIFNDPDLDIVGIYKNIKNGGLHRDLINFFKPKRSRLLYFTIDLVFDDRLFNSIIVEDRPEATKIIQQINDYIPKQDMPFIQNNNGLYKKSYHQEDSVSVYEIPDNSEYGEAIMYLTGFEDDRVNGFYFNRSDLGQDSSTYFLNDHNVCLTLIKNKNIQIHGYDKEWIIALRKDNLDWCDALYVCYDTKYLTGIWHTKSDTPGSITNGRTIIEIDDLVSTDIAPRDVKHDVDMSGYDLDVENDWNVIHPRTKLDLPGWDTVISSPHVKTLREETSSLRHWGPVLCKDPINIRCVFPSGALGHPENLDGSRYSGYDALNRSGDPIGNQEEGHSFNRWPYPDDDKISMYDGLDDRVVHGSADKVTNRTSIDGDTYQSDSNFNNFNETEIVFAKGDGSKTLFKLNVIRVNPYHISIYVNSVKLEESEWSISITTNEQFIQFLTAPSLDSNISYSYSTPIWWVLDASSFYSGPVYHRPLYTGINFIIHDCYPCRDLSDCCDYYDVGCCHDGPTNPQVIKWGPEQRIFLNYIDNLDKGPYLIYPNDPTQMIVLWQTNTDTISTIEWGTTLEYEIRSTSNAEYNSDHQHQYTIQGLIPNTLYYYRVDLVAGSFVSAPSESNLDSIKFFAIGDTKKDHNQMNRVARSMLNTIDTDPSYQSMWLHLGDWSDYDNESSWAAEYFSRNHSDWPELQSKIPVMGCRGNHEGNGIIYQKYMPYPMYVPNTFYYSYNYGPAKIIVVDIFTLTDGIQSVWIENELNNSTSQWDIIILHHGAYSDDGAHGYNPTVRTILQPLCVTYGVHLVLSGHNHFYSHCEADEVHWVTIPSAGKIPRNVNGTGDGLIESSSILSYGKFEIDSDSIKISSVLVDTGKIFDPFMINSDGTWESLSEVDDDIEDQYSWMGGQYQDYSIVKLEYDEHTSHHISQGFLENLDSIWNPIAPIDEQYTIREHWENESLWNISMDNPGDTYCTECDTPLFTPDIAIFEMPNEYKSCGIYHNQIVGVGFTDALCHLNGTWEPGVTTTTHDEDYPYCYVDLNGNEMVHVFDKNSGYHYWEIREIAGSSSSSSSSSSDEYTLLLRSELKEKLHTMDDLDDSDPDNLQVESDNFLNGNDMDPSEDRWTNNLDDPSSFLMEETITVPITQTITVGKPKSEITQTLVDGIFEPNETTPANLNAPDYNVDNPDELSVCGNVVPFLETFKGIQMVTKPIKCNCHVQDSVDIDQIVYCVDPYGGFIKIKTMLISSSSSSSSLSEYSQEHRFIPAAYESQISFPTDFNISTISSLDYYVLNKYIPFFLYSGDSSITIWERDGSEYYSKNYINGYEEDPCYVS